MSRAGGAALALKLRGPITAVVTVTPRRNGRPDARPGPRDKGEPIRAAAAAPSRQPSRGGGREAQDGGHGRTLVLPMILNYEEL